MEQDERIQLLEAAVTQLAAALAVHQEREPLDTADDAGDGRHDTEHDEQDGEQDEPAAARRSRRDAMKLLGAALVGGATAAAATSTPAAADNGISLLGAVNATSSLTRVRYTGGTRGAAFVFEAGSDIAGNRAEFPAALSGWTDTTASPTGVMGWTEIEDGMGVLGVNSFPAPYSAGVAGISDSGIGGAFSGNTGVRGLGVVGAQLEGDDVGLAVAGGRAAIQFRQPEALAAAALPPGATAAPIVGQRGDLTMDTAGDLWFCVVGGAAPVWRRISGATTAGSVHPITPTRVYDSRVPTAQPLAAGQNRTVSIKDGIDLTTGAITQPDVVPAGATAIAYNLTIAATTGKGFLAVTEGGTATYTASTINWFGTGQIIANGSMVKVSPTRDVKVYCGAGTGGSSTHFFIDIVGYYR